MRRIEWGVLVAGVAAFSCASRGEGAALDPMPGASGSASALAAGTTAPTTASTALGIAGDAVSPEPPDAARHVQGAGDAQSTDAQSTDAQSTDAQSTDAAVVNSAAPRTLFWLDVSGKLLRSDAERFAAETLTTATGKGPDGIAVDPVAGFIYWTDMGVTSDDDGSLMRSKLDGSDIQTIIPEGGTYTPKQLKLDASRQWLYWSDREGMRVQRARVDGTALETLYVAATGASARKNLANHCVGIALDPAAGYFYWSQKGPSNGGVGSLRRAHLALPEGETPEARSDVEILYDGLPEPIDIDLDVDNGLVYWTDRGDNTVNRGPIEVPSGFTAKTRTDRQIIVNRVPEAIGIALDLALGLVYYTDASGDVGRARLDGSQAQFLLTDGGAFTGIVVVALP